MTLTITEGLAELKTLRKRIDKKREFINNYIARAEGVKDPLEREGGSHKRIEQELQAVADLENNYMDIRKRIAAANDTTQVEIMGVTRSITDWLLWRRELAPHYRNWLANALNTVRNIRANAQKQGHAVMTAISVNADAKPQDIVINLSENDLSTQLERMEDILGKLDGQLSLKNATTTI